MKFQNVRKVLEDFNDEKVNYCILRNYSDPEFRDVEDVDILVSYKHGFKVKRILKRHGLTKSLLGLHIYSSRLFDIKLGCLEHNGCYIKSGEEVLKNKRKHDYFYILSPTDEFIHIMLKFLYNNKYQPFIEGLSETLSEDDKSKIMVEVYDMFGPIGLSCMLQILDKNYTMFKFYRRALMKNVNTLYVYKSMKVTKLIIKQKCGAIYKKLLYYAYRLMYPALKRNL